MCKIKVLNLYAGIGGNRKLWKNCEVTAVELSGRIANIYQEKYPDYEVYMVDAHKFLLENYSEFDFIWSSPPCQSHSRTNYFLKGKGIVRYPDLRLYEEILLLKHHLKGKWVVENVIPYYNPLIRAQKIGRHLFWSNFIIPVIKQQKDNIGKMCGKNQKAHDIPLEERNMVNPDLGLHVFNSAFRDKQSTLTSIPTIPKAAGILEGVLLTENAYAATMNGIPGAEQNQGYALNANLLTGMSEKAN